VLLKKQSLHFEHHSFTRYQRRSFSSVMSSQSERVTLSQEAIIFSADKIKISTSNLYHDDRDKLEAYLVQIELYIKRHSSQFKFTENKVLFAFIYLRDNAFTWFHHYLTDYLQKKSEKREEKINTMFRDLQTFEKRLRRVFEDIDKKHTAKRQLYNLRQKTFAATYSTSFQHIATNTKWDDAVLISQFYQRLRKKVKNEIARIDRFIDLQKMIIRAMIIDNRQYERRLKKGKESVMSVVLSRKFKKRRWQSYYDSQSMKLDATRKILTNARDKTVQQSKTCYTCEKLDHYFKNCTQNKYKNKSKSYDKQDRSFAATKEDQKDKHQALSWTACYENNCRTHLSDKKDSEWYSKFSRKNRFYAATHRQSEIHDENSDESSFTMIAKPEISDSEAYDSNRSNDIEEAIRQAVEKESRLSETLRAFTIAAKDVLDQEEDCLEVKKDLRKLTSQASFISMYNELYTLFKQKEKDFSQRMQQIKNDIHQAIYDTMQDESIASRKDVRYRDIVMKKSLTEVKFIKQEEYVLSDEDHIFRELRQMTKVIRERFDLCDSKKYSLKKINSNRFQYIEKVLKERASSSKN